MARRDWVVVGRRLGGRQVTPRVIIRTATATPGPCAVTSIVAIEGGVAVSMAMASGPHGHWVTLDHSVVRETSRIHSIIC